MQKTIKNKLLLCLCAIGFITANAQVINPSFELYCGTPTATVCPSFTISCVPGWFRSHGSPQIINGAAAAGNRHAAMWGHKFVEPYYPDSYSGEGIFTNYTFVAGKAYRICMWVRNDNNWGNIVVRAANNLVALADNQVPCGGDVPTASHETIYDQPMVWNNGWTRLTIDYTPSGNYSHLWIYPRSTTANQTVWLNVDDVQVASYCESNITFNMAANTSAGTVAASNYVHENIFAGSSSTSPPSVSDNVVNSSAGNVVFQAGTAVLLTANFNAKGYANNTFIARIFPCENFTCEAGSNGNTEGITGEPEEPFMPGEGSEERLHKNAGALYSDIAVYPNPTNGTLRFSGLGGDEHTYKFASITGQVLLHGTIASGGVLDIGKYPQGVYFIEITNSITKNISFHKIIKE